MWNVIFSSKCREDKYVFPNLSKLSSYPSRNIKGEISHFQSSPLYDSLDHEDDSICKLKLFDHGYRDIFIHSFYHNYDFFTIDLSKPLIFGDPYSAKLEPPQAVEAL